MCTEFSTQLLMENILNSFYKVNEAVISSTAGEPVKRLQGRNYQEGNVLGMYFPYEAQRLTNYD